VVFGGKPFYSFNFDYGINYIKSFYMHLQGIPKEGQSLGKMKGSEAWGVIVKKGRLVGKIE
jgi:hypothetical protein